MRKRDCCRDSPYICRRCYPRKETSIHYAQLAGRFVHCQCLEKELLRYPGPAGIKGLSSENILLNCHYCNLVDLPCDYDYYGNPLEDMPSCVSREVCESYARQDALIIEEQQAMTFADTDYFYADTEQLHTVQTQKFPLFNFNGDVIGIVFLINDFFPSSVEGMFKMPDFSNLAKPLSMAETRLIYCKRLGLSDSEAAAKMGVNPSTVRTLKTRIRDKTNLTVDQLRRVLSKDVSRVLIKKKDSFRVR